MSKLTKDQSNNAKPDVGSSLRMLKKQLREAVANYMYSEGCNCCRGNDHDAHAEALAKLLSVKKYSDGSGFDFYSYRTGAKLNVGDVSGWRYFSSQHPKWNSNLEIVWSDGTEDIFNWTKPNAEQLDFDIDCKPIKWRYACR